MINGTVKWFSARRGFGFIAPESGGADAFVHISALDNAGISDLREGQKVSYDLVPDGSTGTMTAATLELLG